MSLSHLACAPRDLADSLAQAEQMCLARGGKLTPLRRTVLRLLIESGTPVKAYDLLGRLDGEGAAKPPTVYRSLDFLLQMGLVHRIESLNAFVACGHRDHGHAAVFLICEQCGQAGELHASATVSALAADVARVGFVARNSVIEVRGACADCL